MISTKLKKLVDPRNECCCAYHLAHKCKEKAYDLGFDIYSDFNGADVCRIGSNYSIAPFHHNVTEVEAIIKSYEWILENKGTR